MSFSIIRPNWNLIGISREEQRILRKNIGSLLLAFRYRCLDAAKYSREIETIRAVESAYGIDSYLGTVPAELEPEEISIGGVEDLIRNSKQAIIGFFGPVGAGKTVFLEYLKNGNSIAIQDEFWSKSNGYEEKKAYVQRAIAEGKVVVVAACYIEDEVNTMIYLHRTNQNIKSNLERRSRNKSDRLRLQCPAITDIIDFHFCILPKISADYKLMLEYT